MAYVEAISNGGSGTTAARANAIRSGYFDRSRVVVQVRTSIRKIRKDSITIREATGGEPSVADLVEVGGTGTIYPFRGDNIIIGHGTTDNRLFGGRIQATERRIGRVVEKHPGFDIEAAGYERDLAAMAVAPGLVVRSLSATSIALELCNACTPSAADMGLSSTYIQTGLPILAEFKARHGESVLDAFTRLADVSAAMLYVDHHQHIHLFETDSVDPQPRPTISTMTETSKIWDLSVRYDNSQIVTVAVGYGGRVQTSADVWSNEHRIPVTAIDPICDVSTTASNSAYRRSSSDYIAIDGVVRGKTPTALDHTKILYKEAIWQASPFSLMDNFYWVGGMAANYPGSLYMNDRVWWADGAYSWRVESLVVVSTSANTIYHHFIVPSSGPGAPPPTAVGALADGHLLTVPEFYELRSTNSVSDAERYIIPSGTDVRAFYTVSNSAEISGGGWYGSPAARIVTGRVDEDDLSPKRLMQACDALLEDGAPRNWVTLEFQTRDGVYQRGQTIYASVTSYADGASGYGIAGTYQITNVEIGGFDETAPTLGPARRITATISRPNRLWRLLRLGRD